MTIVANFTITLAINCWTFFCNSLSPTFAFKYGCIEIQQVCRDNAEIMGKTSVCYDMW